MKFEVQELDRSYVVNLFTRTCSCRYWDICGIPCKHVISCIIWLKEDPDQYVDNYYKREAYMKTYEFLLEPLTGKDTWPEVGGPFVLPPRVKKMSGRPKKKRRREINEDNSSTSILSRRGTIITCHMCHQVGHNRRCCPRRAQASSSRRDTDTQAQMNQPSSSRGRARSSGRGRGRRGARVSSYAEAFSRE
ncbi:transcription factor interactor and regulator CCHC(Zn) family [Canna indica]|uniref:Transcription factor interactor and regulator CCHC(Zn) family n=1 Tax=Canna indica TaxID=4628 RepID=A0AAQ3QFN7_9LILI|nr:transcription factor interactor and regulator CCHC(Zn) family [Canna indica]